MDIGVFIPIGSNGWLISTTSPQYKPSWALNRDVVVKAEKYGMEFALSMTKLRGFAHSRHAFRFFSKTRPPSSSSSMPKACSPSPRGAAFAR